MKNKKGIYLYQSIDFLPLKRLWISQRPAFETNNSRSGRLPQKGDQTVTLTGLAAGDNRAWSYVVDHQTRKVTSATLLLLHPITMSSSKPTYPSTNPGTPSPAATPLPRNFAPLSRSDSLTNLTETGTQLSSTYEGEENGNSDGAKGRAEGSTFDGRGSVLSGLETGKQWMGSNVNAAGRFDLGNLNLVSWKQDVLPEHEKRTMDGDEQEAERRPFRLGGSNFNREFSISGLT